MELKIKDIIDLLQVSEKTVYRWIKEKKIPCYRINHQYRFSRSEINEWILESRIELASKLLNLSIANRPTNFTKLIVHGGIHYDIPGATVPEVLHNAIAAMPTPARISKEDISTALLNREELMSTAIGRGIAIPHPRNPIITDIEDASVSLCFLQTPLDFGALDGLPVHTFFVLLTATPRRHLEVLSKISYLCQMDDFLRLLQQRASAAEIINFIQTKELAWQPKEPENR
jgi:PTS system nitrogen regulatory IIA component